MNQKVVNRRVYITGIICLVIAFLFIIKLFSLHFSGKIILSEDRHLNVKRGDIRDKEGYVLATSVEMNSLFGNPEVIKNPSEVARILAPIINISAEKIRKKLSRRGRRFVWLKRKMDQRKADEVRALNIKGLHFRKEYKRVYPHNNLASNVVGFVGVDNIGLEGIEYKYNSILSGEDENSDDRGESEISEGSSVVLTIDRYIQHITEEAIAETVRDYRASQGTVMVFEIKTGRILALARYPNYNPNLYFQYPVFARRNFTIIDSFEPGSTLKILSMAALLEFVPGIVNSSFVCDGDIDVADHTVNCTGVHGNIRIGDIIRYSCNSGMIQAMRRMRNRNFYDLLVRFGFGSRVGVEMPGEAEGILRPVSQWSGLSRYSISIGHEISVTSLQLVSAFGAIANDGVYMTPSIIESVIDGDGTVAYNFQPRTRGRVLRSDIARMLMEMMRSVVANGTGRNAASRFFLVVGKTGTSKKFIISGGYYSDSVLSSFIGMAPYEDPEVCILVVVDDPEGRQSGGQIAAPVFGRLVDRILSRMGVGSRELQGRVPLQVRSRNAVFQGTRVPDFRGSTMGETLPLLTEIDRRYGITYSITGSGRVFSQSPAVGTVLTRGMRITLQFTEDQ